MDNIARLCSLLEEKRERLLAYEQATLAMLECAPEDAEHYIIQRSEIANAVDALDEQVARLCDAEPAGALLMEAALAKLNFEKVPSEFHCVFYGGQSVRSVASRVLESEKQVMARLEKLREEARENIRMGQNLPKIRKYLTGLTENQNEISVDRGKA